MFRERMTPDELAALTGYSRQTINKWVRRERWITSPRPGIQGGKARLIHVDERVREFILSTQRSAADSNAVYQAGETSLENLLLNAVREMNAVEQKQLTSLLLREGIGGMLTRLSIRQDEYG
ncbi:putative DNA-binding transcriptional regulator [Enterobacteriaceae bacterium BIT-l23]|jgi:uncharacterized protein YjcR|uniref:Putative DNA-binding transcriptional regulator n=1 Tax=Jejubacter calystegiae TaxID=2579935 RepID=A0A4P8YQZ7_9ENTR|nr:YfeC-like transcriptional regulator [Jejubacter calystegiae]NUU68615.1 putative DNA-binding transcriptional regulator [Enterobacteriaceae bacterium BIT-l23]QCT22284.1 putative DNA-binding transcriptional regulator [Jejubacter calystegiae]